jgi:hypothetical protein
MRDPIHSVLEETSRLTSSSSSVVSMTISIFVDIMVLLLIAGRDADIRRNYLVDQRTVDFRRKQDCSQ